MASTIPPVREIVMVITDLYLAAEDGASALAGVRLPGIEQLARFGTRTPVGAGWRSWLAQHLGRADLAAAAPAAVAAAAVAAAPSPSRSQWIATPVHLSAGLSRVHLDHRGILRLEPQARAHLAASFAATFASSGLALVPLPCGEFLLRAADIEAVPVTEPERCTGADISAALPQGMAAAALRRTAAEIEMWLHGQPTASAANALWLWGAQGAGAPRAPRLPASALRAFGADAYLDGLAQLQGARCEPLPHELDGVLGAPGAEAVLALRVGAELQNDMVSFAEGLGRLDARFIAPALAALRAGGCGRLTLIANDTLLSMRRRSTLRRWRRARSAAVAFT